jgi:hypothetical protein
METGDYEGPYERVKKMATSARSVYIFWTLDLLRTRGQLGLASPALM